MHGIELVRRVIEKVQNEGIGIMGHVGAPQPLPPQTLEGLRFPNGAPLSPSLREWLAFDASLVGWFGDLETPKLERTDMRAVARAAYGDERLSDEFSVLGKKTLPGDGYLLPRGKLARRFLYAGEPDSTGEYPVLVFDVDGHPFVSVEHPGFDVWLAVTAGLLYPPRQVLGGFADDEVYGPRMKEHADRLFGGRVSLQREDEGFDPEAKHEIPTSETLLLGPADPIPDGYIIVDEFVNPVKGLPMRLVAPAASVRERRADG